ncbi:hypothetical protein B296_00041355 [Ensete ventricosum]|uniref:Uncharacterized protein n=1 Tax=Ensete ventricosum TaxID=4639 RepID=A0A426ZM97_ENSVE|nr:hypothetical protein B296_00041355 [Ensete ventricosum]
MVVVKTARSVAQAAWAQPPLRLSSWSCIGPRHRSKSTVSNSRLEESISGSSTSAKETSEALASSTETTTTLENTEIITSQGVGWTTEYECSQISEISHAAEGDDNEDDSDSEDLMGHGRIEDRMTEVELWQQLENELYRTRQNKDGDLANENEDADLESEIREEQNTTAAEESGGTTEGMLTETKQVHRFYPPGKIMHVVPILPEGTTNQEDSNDGHDDGSLLVEPKFGIFLTRRSLYGKLRLSQTMINDHYMPIYRRNIEQVISELEKDTSSDISGDETIL